MLPFLKATRFCQLVPKPQGNPFPTLFVRRKLHFLSNFHSYFRRNIHTINKQHLFHGAFGIGWREQYAHESRKESLLKNIGYTQFLFFSFF